MMICDLISDSSFKSINLLFKMVINSNKTFAIAIKKAPVPQEGSKILISFNCSKISSILPSFFIFSNTSLI